METLQVIADARRLAQTFPNLPEPEARPAAVIVSGLPGTGKSFFCRQLAARLPFVILESDAIRKKLFANPTYSAAESAYLFRAIHCLMENFLQKGIPVILDATNLNRKHRERLYSIVDRNHAKVIIVQMKTPAEVVQKRLKDRVNGNGNGDNSTADWSVYKKMRPTVEKIDRRHFTVDTSKDVTPSIMKIVKEASR
ncbi:MAG: ATP-binding protein [Dehalococcoidales bacterium]|nr:ATP-binding protein [Dehalococcoidales bacterium]